MNLIKKNSKFRKLIL